MDRPFFSSLGPYVLAYVSEMHLIAAHGKLLRIEILTCIIFVIFIIIINSFFSPFFIFLFAEPMNSILCEPINRIYITCMFISGSCTGQFPGVLCLYFVIS